MSCRTRPSAHTGAERPSRNGASSCNSGAIFVYQAALPLCHCARQTEFRHEADKAPVRRARDADRTSLVEQFDDPIIFRIDNKDLLVVAEE